MRQSLTPYIPAAPVRPVDVAGTRRVEEDQAAGGGSALLQE